MMSPTNSIIELSFNDYEDMTKRLVLLPYIEEEGLGAVVHSYFSAAEEFQSGGEEEKKELTDSDDDEQKHQKDNNAHMGDNVNDRMMMEKIVGCVLVGIKSKPSQEEALSSSSSNSDLRTTEFSTILAMIRKQSPPFLLSLDEGNDDYDEDDNDLSAEGESTSGSIGNCSITSDNSLLKYSGDSNDIAENDDTPKKANNKEAIMAIEDQSSDQNGDASDGLNNESITSYQAATSEAKSTGKVVDAESDACDHLEADADAASDKDNENDEESDDEDDDNLLNGYEGGIVAMVPPEEDGPTPTDPQAPLVTAGTTVDTENSAPVTETVTTPNASRWSSWMRATLSEKLDAVAAQSAASLSSAVASVAAEASELAEKARERSAAAAAARRADRPCEIDTTICDQQRCQIYLQSSSGAFFPLSNAPTSPSPVANDARSTANYEKNVTTASVLLVRLSALQPCPTKGYSFQWYRSSTNSTTSSTDVCDWVLLPGATHAAFQPSAIEVGYRLRCVITMENDDCSSFSDDDDDDDYNDDQEECKQESQQRRQDHRLVEICETPKAVSADLSLFNGARQALVRGANFGGFIGKGKAEGCVFRLTVQMEVEADMTETSCALTIHQIVQGQSPICLTPPDKPLFQVSAACNHSIPRALNLILKENDINSTSLEEITENGVLQLEAPNRLARESLLLAIGITNFKGKPAELDATTILYEDDVTTSQKDTINSIHSQEENLLPSSNHSSREGTIINTSSPPSSPSSRQLPPYSNIDKKHSPCPSTEATSPEEEDCDSTLESVDLVPSLSNRNDYDNNDDNNNKHNRREKLLEKELEILKRELLGKNKMISDLKQDLSTSERQSQLMENRYNSSQTELKQMKSSYMDLQQDLRTIQNKYQSSQKFYEKLQMDHAERLSTIKDQLVSESHTVTELEKNVKSMQNDKAVLQAGIEARDQKLIKMAALQTSFEALSQKVKQYDHTCLELKETNSRLNSIRKSYELLKESNEKANEEILEKNETIAKLTAEIQNHDKKTSTYQQQIDTLTKRIQILKAERNSYKQKTDSLSKEITRICRRFSNTTITNNNNATTTKAADSNSANNSDCSKGQQQIAQQQPSLTLIEQMLIHNETTKEEIEVLKKQKRKVMEELHHYRTSFEQQCQILSGEKKIGSTTPIFKTPTKKQQRNINYDNECNTPSTPTISTPSSSSNPPKKVGILIERNGELERLVLELTEYVNAKEMQLETLKLVNNALQDEIHDLAKVSMGKNEV